MTRKCGATCRACGRHFSGVTAFDAHRTGQYPDRRCIDPLQDDRFGVEDGFCDHDGNDLEVKIYFLIAARESIRNAFKQTE